MLGNKLKSLRKETGKTQQQIADKLGITRAAYSHFENERNQPDSETLVKLADIFETTTDFLLGAAPSNIVPIGDIIPENNSIPVLGRIAASAPAGLVSDYEGELFIQPSTIKRYGKKDLFALKVLGDSMNRVIPDGAIAVVHRTCEWESGDICAVTINGDDATLKQVTKTEKGIKFTPLSFSKFHAPWEYIKDEDEVDVCILGTFLYGVIPTDKM